MRARLLAFAPAAVSLIFLLGAGAAAPSDDWENFVDGLKIRRTVSPPDARQGDAGTRSGDFCEIQFYAWELAQDGVTRRRLVDAAPFGQPARQLLAGEGREPAPLELSVIGLRPGEGRQLLAPPGRWQGVEGAVLVDVQILERKSGVKVDLLTTRTGPQLVRAAHGDRATFAWTLALLDADGNPQPVALPAKDVTCTLGDGTLVRGLDFGLRGMAAGETRSITVPPHLGYGDKGAGGDLVPPGGVMRFTVQMRKVEKAPERKIGK